MIKEYILSVAGMAIVTSVVSILIGEKKYTKTVNGVLKLCMLVTLVTPLLTVFRQNTTNFFSSERIFEQDAAYINNSYSLAVESQLKSQFNVSAQAEVSLYEERGDIKRVKIYILDFGMNEKEEHINIITQIADAVKLLCNCNDVEVYENVNTT